jgi:hypothetical protein
VRRAEHFCHDADVRVLKSLAGPVAFGAASVVVGRRTPGYRPRDEPISALAAKDVAAAPLMVGGFLALAAGQAMFARDMRGSRAVPAPIPTMITAAAATTAVAGLARHSEQRCPSRTFGDKESTWSDELHVASSFVTFLLWLTTPYVASTHAERASTRYRRASLAIGVTSTIVMVGGGALARKRAPWAGVGQRVLLALFWTWYPLAAAQPR